MNGSAADFHAAHRRRCVEGGPTRWIALADKPGTFYLSQVGWAGNSDEVLVEKFSRYRTRGKSCVSTVAPARSPKPTRKPTAPGWTWSTEVWNGFAAAEPSSS